MDLRVAVHRAVGRREHEHVRGPVASPAARSGTEPHTHTSCVARLLDEELRARAVERLGDAIGRHREPGREHLGEHDESRALGRRALAISGASRSRSRRGSSHTMSCWTAATFSGRVSGPSAASTASSITSTRLQHAKRTSGRPASRSS